jgi:ssDNA thymidine ADP-ribosyltransferase, DarT
MCIGNPELISKRNSHPVPISPGGTLSDYPPFYFTHFSPMLLNIRSGRNVTRVPNEEIVIFVSSLPKLKELSVPFVFTDRHAFLRAAQFYDDLNSLHLLDWDILQNRDFRRDPNNPEKFERYEAETLVYQKVPVDSLLGIICYNEEVEASLKATIAGQSVRLRTVVDPGHYFP